MTGDTKTFDIYDLVEYRFNKTGKLESLDYEYLINGEFKRAVVVKESNIEIEIFYKDKIEAPIDVIYSANKDIIKEKIKEKIEFYVKFLNNDIESLELTGLDNLSEEISRKITKICGSLDVYNEEKVKKMIEKDLNDPKIREQKGLEELAVDDVKIYIVRSLEELNRINLKEVTLFKD